MRPTTSSIILAIYSTAFLLLAAGLSGCVGLAVGAGATAGTAAMQDRGLGGVIDDAGDGYLIDLSGANSGELVVSRALPFSLYPNPPPGVTHSATTPSASHFSSVKLALPLMAGDAVAGDRDHWSLRINGKVYAYVVGENGEQEILPDLDVMVLPFFVKNFDTYL